jgi:hypothetical protein
MLFAMAYLQPLMQVQDMQAMNGLQEKIHNQYRSMMQELIP